LYEYTTDDIATTTTATPFGELKHCPASTFAVQRTGQPPPPPPPTVPPATFSSSAGPAGQ
jgi:hypothetical protein